MDEAEAFRRATSRRRNLRLAGLALLLAAPFGYLAWQWHERSVRFDAQQDEYRRAQVLSPDEIASLRTAVGEARATLAAARDGWLRVVTPDALAAIVPEDSACPVHLSAPTMEAGESYVQHGSIDGNYFGNLWFDRFPRAGPYAPTAIGSALGDLDDVGERLAAGTADRSDLSAVDGLHGYTVFVAVDRETAAFVMPDAGGIASYTPATLAGTAYIYSFNQQRITCAGPIDVASPESLAFDFSYMAGNITDRTTKMREAAEAILARDLDVRAKQMIAGGLRAVR